MKSYVYLALLMALGLLQFSAPAKGVRQLPRTFVKGFRNVQTMPASLRRMDEESLAQRIKDNFPAAYNAQVKLEDHPSCRVNPTLCDTLSGFSGAIIGSAITAGETTQAVYIGYSVSARVHEIVEWGEAGRDNVITLMRGSAREIAQSTSGRSVDAYVRGFNNALTTMKNKGRGVTNRVSPQELAEIKDELEIACGV